MIMTLSHVGPWRIAGGLAAFRSAMPQVTHFRSSMRPRRFPALPSRGARLGLALLISIGLTVPVLASHPERSMPDPIRVESYRDVDGATASHGGRSALALELTAAEQARQLAGAGGNRPTFAVVPGLFGNGVIEVDVAADLNGRGGADARGFAGVVFGLGADERFDAVYLRFSNGSLNTPPPPAPRHLRAIQYISHPDFHFDVSRTLAPGVYEKGAPIGLSRWHRLRLEINGPRLVASIDGEVVLRVDDRRLDRPGRVALWVGDGTRAYFANLRVVPAIRDTPVGSGRLR